MSQYFWSSSVSLISLIHSKTLLKCNSPQFKQFKKWSIWLFSAVITPRTLFSSTLHTEPWATCHSHHCALILTFLGWFPYFPSEFWKVLCSIVFWIPIAFKKINATIILKHLEVICFYFSLWKYSRFSLGPQSFEMS